MTVVGPGSADAADRTSFGTARTGSVPPPEARVRGNRRKFA